MAAAATLLAIVTLFGFKGATEKNRLLRESLALKESYALAKNLPIYALPFDGQLDIFKRKDPRSHDCPALHEKSAYFNKLAALLYVMEYYRHVEWFWYQDLDTVITNWEKDPLDLIYMANDDQHFIGCVHSVSHFRHPRRGRTCTSYTDRYHGFFAFNGGVFFVRNSNTAKQLLLAALCQSTSTNQTWIQLAPELSNYDERLPWSDQAAMSVAFELYAAQATCPILMLPQRVFNSQARADKMHLAEYQQPTCVYWRPGDWIAHAFGCRAGDACLKLLRDVINYGHIASNQRWDDQLEYQRAAKELRTQCELPTRWLDYREIKYIPRKMIVVYAIAPLLVVFVLLCYLRRLRSRCWPRGRRKV
eukprot:TRINITY_DN9470_c0_g2_i1.p1 TRINITY_DN9470_c0_g2~~TRINITY_DN9470_c0_g2_i1.p1  ORF type:complete len:362 (+),score=38.16 TRINITY_DN9470_c0_g2_i1:874-1959(+)